MSTYFIFLWIDYSFIPFEFWIVLTDETIKSKRHNMDREIILISVEAKVQLTFSLLCQLGETTVH